MQLNDQSIEIENISLFELVESVLSLSKTSIEAKGIKLQSTIQEGTRINCNYAILHLVLRNILSNAIKYSKRGGIINLIFSKSSSQGNWTISIKDEGVGIDTNVASVLFKKRLMQPVQGTANERGTGLGLLICSDYLAKINCSISFTSTLGKGATFTVSSAVKSDPNIQA